jgi:endonuclease G
LRPVNWDLASPTKRMGLNILQHPGGESMKLALSSNGVTGVYPETGLIQYLTSTRGGSSGSPCFSDEWALVALHHAERSRMFGTIREGILFRAIHSEISSYLSGA